MKEVVISKNGDCPYCGLSNRTSCPYCNYIIQSKEKTLCTPEYRIVIWSWFIIKIKCEIPGRHFHVKCIQDTVTCFGSKNGKRCGNTMGARYDIIIGGCGGTWIEPVDEDIVSIDMSKFVELMKNEKKLQNILK